VEQEEKRYKFSHSGYAGESSHSHTQAATPASATYHSPPLEACSLQSASYSPLGGATPLSFASLGT